MTTPFSTDLTAAAGNAQTRLFWQRYARGLGSATIPVMAVAGAVVVLMALLAAESAAIIAVLAVIPLWLIAVAVWAWITREPLVRALACWDAASDRHEALLSAWAFALQV